MRPCVQGLFVLVLPARGHRTPSFLSRGLERASVFGAVLSCPHFVFSGLRSLRLCRPRHLLHASRRTRRVLHLVIAVHVAATRRAARLVFFNCASFETGASWPKSQAAKLQLRPVLISLTKKHVPLIRQKHCPGLNH